jgi:hypothetical protein
MIKEMVQVQNESKSHLGITVALVMGLVTALAATIAVVVKAKRTEPPVLDAFDNWEEVIGI